MKLKRFINQLIWIIWRKTYRRNVLKKNKSQQLNKKGLISYIKKCFAYALYQFKQNTKIMKLSAAVWCISNHLFNLHENCDTWCKVRIKQIQGWQHNNLLLQTKVYLPNYKLYLIYMLIMLQNTVFLQPVIQMNF